jgi:hypothetical protein
MEGPSSFVLKTAEPSRHSDPQSTSKQQITSTMPTTNSFRVRSRGAALLAAAGLVAVALAPGFLGMRRRDVLRPGPGVTRTVPLSSWAPALADTPGDTPVYVLDGAKAGATVLVLGGTHADEPAGYLAAVVLLEQARVSTGRLIVIPRANASGFTHNFPQEAHPSSFVIQTHDGPRRFTLGARVTNPVDQWPDPQVYTLRESGQTLSGSETRNLNRAYPGRVDGTLTERIAFAITTLLRRERVDLAIDLHEASPEYPVVNTIVAHQRATDMAALASMDLQAAGIAIGFEQSPLTLHGLSHREWGDSTGALAVLMESANPAQGRLRGRTDAALVMLGRDRFYTQAADEHRLSVPFPSGGWPLSVRVARHLAGVQELANRLGDIVGRRLTLSGIPPYRDVVTRGLGAYLDGPVGHAPDMR